MIQKPEIILCGGGGHCKSVIDVIEAENEFRIAGIVDIPAKVGQKILDYEIIASDADIPVLSEKYKYFIVTVGFIDNPNVRIKIFKILKQNSVKLPVIISPNAYVSKYSRIGAGTVIMHGAIINAGTHIGENCIINSKALIEHDSRVGDNCHVSTAAVINGSCIVGDECFVGSNSVLHHGVEIRDGVIIGAASVVRRNIVEKGVYVGNTARMIKKI